MPSTTFERHRAAIQDKGEVTKSNVIGLRKILNAQWRRDRGYSVSVTAPAVTPEQAAALQRAIPQEMPRVTGDLHETGLKLLRSPRYAKRWGSHESHVIAGLCAFRLVDFIDAGEHGGQFVPVYQARSIDGASFRFYNVAWQSGGDGPQIVEPFTR